MNDLSLGARLKRARMNKGLTQEALARQLDVVSRTIIMWEKGESEPRASQVSELCRILQIEPTDLLDAVTP